MSQADAALVPLFAALGNPTRLSLVVRLSPGVERSIAALAAGTGLSRQAVAKHLDLLEQAGLVAASRAGRETRFSLRTGRLTDASRYLDGVAARWDEALQRLKAQVEE